MIWLWRWMEEEGKRQDWLAKKTGYSSGHLTNVRKGKCEPSRAFKCVLSISLGMPIEKLFAEVSDDEQVA